MRRLTYYLETSVISYLTSRQSRDTVLAARQLCTKEWWAQTPHSDVWVSALAIAEISRGDPQAASARKQFVAHLPLVSDQPDTAALAQRLMAAKVVPATEAEDATHIALATLAGFDYLVTWNFSHFVSPQAKYQVFKALDAWGYKPALFATPEELLEGLPP
jgi:predicted nucleic acid-binding protein